PLITSALSTTTPAMTAAAINRHSARSRRSARCTATRTTATAAPACGIPWAAPRMTANHAHWYATKFQRLNTAAGSLPRLRCKQVMAHEPFASLAITPQLRAGHEEHAPALQPQGCVTCAVGCLEDGQHFGAPR